MLICSTSSARAQTHYGDFNFNCAHSVDRLVEISILTVRIVFVDRLVNHIMEISILTVWRTMRIVHVYARL